MLIHANSVDENITDINIVKLPVEQGVVDLERESTIS
jgi:hypothetical protein